MPFAASGRALALVCTDKHLCSAAPGEPHSHSRRFQTPRGAPPVHSSNEQRCGSSGATSRFVIPPAESHMSRETIKDRYQRTLGYIITEGSGRQKALDAAQRTLGYYYPQQDVTKDAAQRTIAHGNVLASLIFDAG